MKWGSKTSPVLKALNNLLSQFGNNLDQFDVFSNKICCCLPISAAAWMTVNLHFLIKLARIFIRGLGYANGNVVYSRLTAFWNKFKRETFAGRKKMQVIVFNLFHSFFSGGNPCILRSPVKEVCFTAVRWLVSPCQPMKNTHFTNTYFFNTNFRWCQKIGFFFLSLLTFIITYTPALFISLSWG